MALCKWHGGACERETLDPSRLCSEHRSGIVVISGGKPKADLEDFILKSREWDETGRTNKKLLTEILELQSALGICRGCSY
jgi:hypothetical protein